MNAMRVLVAFAVLMAVSLLSTAQQPQRDGSDVPEGDAPREPQTEPRDDRPLDEIFIPSEEIAADEEVTFPVNI